ncbi:ParM/StbA family protein (plasmid) [Cyanobacterium sp. IPPAS B-1200]|uniref:ParM/StbA family protein n=1 Tax=Cyanobacterium sp. IPPAS B-1200 TaxID=1562720 RepID=UPI00085273D9|nr:ParM/StbA family protein [Cyanobacterium sp. IPPAS B-1200]OEJ77704.1 hypothetical protein A5482_15290 [Cyanobacterium sp. IPPAS B-1200]
MVEEKKKKLILTLDFGGSATKIIGGLSGAKRKTVVMNPEICEMPLESLQSKSMAGIRGARQNRAWVGVNGEYYAVGYLAKSYLATPQLKPLKASLAIPKILSACWVMAEQFKLGAEFDISLACFLPPGEYEDRAKFENELELALSEFETPNGTFKVSLLNFECKPEGVGVFMEHWRLEKETASNSLCVNLMFGYRNASAVLVEKGNIGKFQTTDLGFIQMVESVQQKTSGYTIEKLTEAISSFGDGSDDSCLMSMLRQETKEARVIELDNLKSQIQIAKIEYLSRLKNWLREVVPKDVEQIVISGGTADYLKPDLKEWAKTVSPVTLFWHGGVKLPEDIQAVGLGNRMADVWVLWHYFCIEIKKKNRVVK